MIPSTLTMTARVQQRHMMTTPSLWPLWPFLPVVRWTSEGWDLGVMFDARGACDITGYSATVFLTLLFFAPKTPEEFLALPREVYDTCDELLDSGWRVD